MDKYKSSIIGAFFGHSHNAERNNSTIGNILPTFECGAAMTSKFLLVHFFGGELKSVDVINTEHGGTVSTNIYP